MADFNHSRRQMLKGSAAAMALGAIGSLGALYSRQASAAASGATRLAPVPGPYGPLAPVADRATGLELLQLPRGFSYTSLGWTGDLMDDGQPVPDRHDGMAVLQHRRDDGNGQTVIVRNHERGVGTPIQAPGMYDTGVISDDGHTGTPGGGTTTLTWHDGRLHAMEASLGGTLVNCAGGPTPWGTWLSCEEVKSNAVSADGHRHGYVFEVHPDPARTSGRPIIGMGRFKHEAVAVDPRTGYVYLTEDDRNKSTLYRYVPDDTSGRPGSLANGGRLQAARVRGRRNADLGVAAIGDRYQLEWVDIEDPDLDNLPAPAGFPDIDAGETLSGPFAQAWTAGALRLSRGEGIWHAGDSLFIVDTATGVDAAGRRGHGDGAVWVLDLPSQTLRALFVSGNQLAANNPDNVTVSPRGGVVLCEDGGESLDRYGPGARLLGLTPTGESFYLAKNNAELTSTAIADAGKQVAEGDYRRGEFCGACWDPAGTTLFVNIQTPGITLAITGPWQHGQL
ncbi:MAG: PhoX family protein [Gammaproteobacteria bacterium]|nr:PhoX family protein [Gammaproteobacteria bacterium]